LDAPALSRRDVAMVFLTHAKTSLAGQPTLLPHNFTDFGNPSVAYIAVRQRPVVCLTSPNLINLSSISRSLGFVFVADKKKGPATAEPSVCLWFGAR
jgi:hypothetical protein